MNEAESVAIKRLRKKKRRLGLLMDGLVFGGWALVSAGVGLLSISAGLVVAGALAIAGGVLIGRGISS